MSLDVTFTLTDDDLARFQSIVDKSRHSKHDENTHAQIEAAARGLIDESRSGDLPQFIADRVEQLDVVLDMINDGEWQLEDKEREAILDALAYFCEAEDLIPDHVPGLGFLDDAIYVEVVLKELQHEIALYREFCSFREAEESRRKARGEDVKVGREAWLADKRAALHAKMRKRRMISEQRFRLF